MHARMAAALGSQAELERVSINPETHAGEVVVRLPDDLIERVRDTRIAWVRATLADLMADVFAAEEFVLNEVHIARLDDPRPESFPIRPRRGRDWPKISDVPETHEPRQTEGSRAPVSPGSRW